MRWLFESDQAVPSRGRRPALAAMLLVLLMAAPGHASEPADADVRPDAIAELGLRQESIAAALQNDLRAADPEGFGGVWIDADSHIHVALKGEASALREIVAAAPLGKTPTIHEVEFSESELDAAMGRLSAKLSSDPELATMKYAWIATYVPSNRIVVRYNELTSAQRQRLTDDFGGILQLDETDEKVELVACSRTNCGGPMKAGLQLYKHTNWTACMSAFMFRDQVLQNKYWITSAGHCYDAVNQLRYHPAGVQVGNSQSQFRQTSTPLDVMFIQIAQGFTSNDLYISSTFIRQVTAIQSTQNEVTGQAVCSSKLSGVGCGTLQSTNVCMVGGICGQRLASGQYACSGDSGSPVYQTTSSTTARAMGIITASTSGSSPCANGDPVGSSSLYTHIQLAANAAGATIITN